MPEGLKPGEPLPAQEEEPLRELLERTVGVLSTREYETELAIIDRLSSQDLEGRSRRIENTRKAAINATSPEDWVLNRDRQGNESAMLTGPGAQLVAQFYAISVTKIMPEDPRGVFAPVRIDGDGGEYAYVAWCDAVCGLTGGTLTKLECRRSSSEDFIGRAAIKGTTEIVKEGDLRASVYTLAMTKPVRLLAAMTRVPIGVLRESWAGNNSKSVENCRKGSGYGTSTERGATGVTEADVLVSRKELAEEVLRTVGGSQGDAKALLKEITANPEKNFAGFDSAERLTKQWMVDRAWERLRKHALYTGSETK